jgi:hypothetical protein
MGKEDAVISSSSHYNQGSAVLDDMDGVQSGKNSSSEDSWFGATLHNTYEGVQIGTLIPQIMPSVDQCCMTLMTTVQNFMYSQREW